MDYQNFFEWLIKDHSMGKRSARDVLSRLKRVVNITEVSEVDASTSKILENSDGFDKASPFVKSQLKRSVILYIEFTKKNND